MMRFEFVAVMEDGARYPVVADQRDIAAFEIHPDGCSFREYLTRPFTFARFCSWHALVRQRTVDMSWTDFDAACVEVETKDEDEPADAEDPGQPVASAGT